MQLPSFADKFIADNIEPFDNNWDNYMWKLKVSTFIWANQIEKWLMDLLRKYKCLQPENEVFSFFHKQTWHANLRKKFSRWLRVHVRQNI